LREEGLDTMMNRILVLALLIGTTVAFTPVSPSFAAKPTLLQKSKTQSSWLSSSYSIATTATTTTTSTRYATISKKDDGIDFADVDTDNNFDVEQQKVMLLGTAIPYEQLTIGVLKETYPGENRVAQTPDSVRTLIKAGMNVVVQAGGK
jgi:Alanine dehydrogenase/PNT, N-terminal domain